MGAGTPAGWYPDGQGGERWWDGTSWTDHSRQIGGGAPQPGFGAPQQQGGYGAPQQQGGYGAPQQQGGYGAPQQGFGQQGAYGQPGYGSGSGGGGKGKGGLIIGIVALVVILIAGAGVVGFLVLRDDDGGGGGPLGGGPDSPGEVVEAVFEAVKERDCGIVDYYSAATLEQAEEAGFAEEDCEEDPDEFFGTEEDLADCELEVTDESEDGDTATVTYDVTECSDDSDNEEGEEFELVKEDDEWKLDLAGGGDMMPDGSSESP